MTSLEVAKDKAMTMASKLDMAGQGQVNMLLRVDPSGLLQEVRSNQ